MSAGETAVPLAEGSEADAAIIRGLFDRASFAERAIAEHLRMTTLDAVDLPIFKSLRHRLSGAGLLETLSALFLFGEAVHAEALETRLTEEERRAIQQTGLVQSWQPSAEGEPRIFSPVRLVPIAVGSVAGRDLLLASDRPDHPDERPFTPFADIVFSGHNPLTRQFLKLLPQTPCRALLDLCSGSGVGALAQSPIALQGAAVDVASRSVHFARFNAWLNGCDSTEMIVGDLYRPVAGRTFDRIIAHPPYVPALKQRLTYRDAGETGEAIVRAIVAGIPEHLDAGGTFHLLFLGMDTDDGSIEDRARGWLGGAGDEFDIIFAMDSRTPPELIATRLVERAGGSTRDLERWREVFQQIHVQNFVYGALVGRRLTADDKGRGQTRRVLLGDHTTGESFTELLDWFDWFRLPDCDARVLSLTPRVSPETHLEVRHGVQENTFVPEGYALSNGGKPFYAVVKTEAWVAALLNEFDGQRSVQELYASAVARERIPADFKEPDLIRLICFLLERGYILR